MTCREIRDGDTVEQYVLGDLSEHARREFEEHYFQCPRCLDEVQALQYLQAALRESADAIRREQSDRRLARIRVWKWMWAPAVALMLLVGLAVRWMIHPANAPPPPQVNAHLQPRVESAAGVLLLEKPPVRISARGALVWRGVEGPGKKQFTADMERALAPYRADDFAGAARLLEGLRRKYPQTPQVFFYLGVSQIFLGHYTDAISNLKQAKASGAGALTREAGWYLAVAYFRNGARQPSVDELQDLCKSEGDHAVKACAALTRLSSKSGGP